MDKTFADHVRAAVDGPVLLFARQAQLALLVPVDDSFQLAVMDATAALRPTDGSTYSEMRDRLRKDGWAVLGRLR